MNSDPHDLAFSEPPEAGDPVPHTPEPPLEAEAPAVEPVAALPATAAVVDERRPYADRVPRDARVPWGWLDIALVAALAIGATFFFGIAIVLGLLAFGVSPAHLRNSPTYEGMVAIIAQILADGSVMVFLAAQARMRFRAPFWSSLGWLPLGTGNLPRGPVYMAFIFLGFALAVVVSVLDSAFPSKQTLPIQELLSDHRTALLFMLTAVLVAPLVEETIFRGYLYPVCVRSFGMGWGIIATGTMFGLLHSIQLWGGWWQISFLVLVGIVLTGARAITGTVVASYLVHVSYNALPVFAYLVGTYGFHQTPALH